MGNKKSKEAKEARYDWQNEYPLTASSEKSLKVWSSFGIGISFLVYLTQFEQFKLENLNTFFYRVAVSRVQSHLKLTFPVYLTWLEGPEFSRTIFKYNTHLR